MRMFGTPAHISAEAEWSFRHEYGPQLLLQQKEFAELPGNWLLLRCQQQMQALLAEQSRIASGSP